MTRSVFRTEGFPKTLRDFHSHVRQLYLSNPTPWVIAYSGGKDSTTTLHLIWTALSELRPEELIKPVHIICVDTGVENPIFAAWARLNIEAINRTAQRTGLPFKAHILTPETSESFWVQLIGRGYASPRRRFRWCTDRLKVRPVNRFIRRVLNVSGEAIIVLGLRRQESIARAKNMKTHEQGRTERYLSPYAGLTNAWVYSPIEDWSDDDVWLYLMQCPSPWQMDHRELLAMYRGATADAECPLVTDEGGSFCGNSRFGCWVCTLIERDRSMDALIENDASMRWLLPMRELRNKLKINDHARRDFRRARGDVKLFIGRPIPGLYTREARHQWLRDLLEAQRDVQRLAPPAFKDTELIKLTELEEIRRIWMSEKHELADSLPLIYEQILERPYPGPRWSDHAPFSEAELKILKDAVDGDELLFDLTRNLLDVELQFKTKVRRAGLFEALEEAFRKGFFTDRDDAIARAEKIERVLSPPPSNSEEPS